MNGIYLPFHTDRARSALVGRIATSVLLPGERKGISCDSKDIRNLHKENLCKHSSSILSAKAGRVTLRRVKYLICLLVPICP